MILFNWKVKRVLCDWDHGHSKWVEKFAGCEISRTAVLAQSIHYYTWRQSYIAYLVYLSRSEFLAAEPEIPGSILGATKFSEK
jgi:hypothetical protein